MGKREEYLEAVEAATPALRRYARALTGGGAASVADELVQETLVDLGRRIRAKELRPADGEEARLAAYRSLTALAGRKLQAGAAEPPSARHPTIVHGLAALPIEDRAALLLVALEGLGYDAAARILGATREAALARVMRARAALSAHDRRSRAGSRRVNIAPHLRVVK